MYKITTIISALVLGLCSQFSMATPQSPQQFFGYPVGEWHLRHDQIQMYFQQLAATSDKARLEVIGYTHEQKPVLQLIVSSAENLKKLEQIRVQHLAQLSVGTELTDELPLVIWLGYGVHGNESSGPNASVQLAHHLLTSTDAEVQDWLKNTVILIQPSLNPDGLDRFAHWANMHKGKAPVADSQSREHIEPWPNGRPNHYWFDLNRDWLPLEHPESQARIRQFYKWRPAVVGDFHEMGPNTTFFFQPGIPTRTYPLTPKANQQLTAKIADYHAAALDKKSRLYYTEESFDDFYVGKGSTYPDVNASVGILFEQASSRGHLQDSINGPLSFSKTIENQYIVSLSTLRGSVAQKKALQSYQKAFVMESQRLAADDSVAGYVIAEAEDKTRLAGLLNVLKQHQIKAYPINERWQHKGQTYQKGQAYYIPLQQSQYLLLKAAFSTQTNFRDNTFYDVSAWTLPYAFNIEFSAVARKPAGVAKDPWQPQSDSALMPSAGAYAYAFDWADQKAPLLTQALLDQGVVIRAASKAFFAKTADGEQAFSAGAIVIAAGLQQHNNWFERLGKAQQQVGLNITALTSGLTAKGQDLGSNGFVPVTKPNVLVVAGPDVNSTEAGEVWFNLEKLAGISPSLIEPQRLGRVDLSRYTHIILPDGSYNSLQQKEQQQLSQWAKKGGVLWGHKGGAAFLVRAGLLKAKAWTAADMAMLISDQQLSYADKESLAGQRRIAGAIYQTALDLSHPLTFGINRKDLAVFKNSTFLLAPSGEPFINVALYTDKPQLAGYTAPEYVSRIAEGAALMAHNHGDGRVIGMTDNPVFRGYFVGSSRLLVNALFFGKMFSAESSDGEGEEANNDEEEAH
ncbi:MAG: peptidase M14 [Gammaproteobacteria bacterium]|nr:peptidase M14 [Gammaproteobacteria bacterium]MBU2059195.1 peptidase M14 [Gammaproteobacteria bacterium]MBU2173746.1 peptidase M14 [Gammaproteobacteria bacterium]MBU2246902.1 peptidase M14 [Gammaproteobacteria bacterium]MBU2343472.1 peptidase M14 [Gammaproteobacteria bacterium]